MQYREFETERHGDIKSKLLPLAVMLCITNLILEEAGSYCLLFLVGIYTFIGYF